MPPRPIARKAPHPAALRQGDVGQQAERSEERAPRELCADADGELALEEPGRRPRDRSQRDERPPAAALVHVGHARQFG
jgi:hypothetical protein